jgi:hypothetical protein
MRTKNNLLSFNEFLYEVLGILDNQDSTTAYDEDTTTTNPNINPEVIVPGAKYKAVQCGPHVGYYYICPANHTTNDRNVYTVVHPGEDGDLCYKDPLDGQTKCASTIKEVIQTLSGDLTTEGKTLFYALDPNYTNSVKNSPTITVPGGYYKAVELTPATSKDYARYYVYPDDKSQELKNIYTIVYMNTDGLLVCPNPLENNTVEAETIEEILEILSETGPYAEQY